MHSTVNSALIFEGMRHATQALLAEHQAWAEDRIGAFTLEIKLGRGRRTYLRHARSLQRGRKTGLFKPARAATETGYDFQLVYGRHCIEDMFDDEQYWRWKSFKEIEQYGCSVNADADAIQTATLTPLQHLAHIVMHEFSHFIQAVLGQRYDGSVHNREFYNILNDSYNAGAQQSVIQCMIQHAEKCPVTMTALHQTYPPKPKAATTPAHDFIHGQRVSFTYQRQRYQGTIVRLNKQRATVQPHTHSGAPFAKALIPYAQLRPTKTPER